jgi:uncharacterized protein (TIGR02996 family)
VDPVVAARKLVGELVNDEQIEVRRAELVVRDLAKHVEALGRPPSGLELEDWLGEHAQVTELYASASTLEELVYRHLTPPPPQVAISESEHRHPELEQQIRDAVDSSAPYLVYADWLQERGDPFGELIALGVAATASRSDDDVARFERHRKLHEQRFLGGLKQSGLGLQWRFGVVHAVRELIDLDTIPLATWETLFRLRVCDFLAELALRRSCTRDLDALIDEHAAPTLRAITLEGYQHWPVRTMTRPLQAFAITGSRFTLQPDMLPPTLERLELDTHELAIGSAFELAVRELRLTFSDSAAEALPLLRLPKLERLALEIEPGAAGRVVKLLETLELPALSQLAISDGTLDAKAFGKLARLPVAEGLTSLALTNLELTDDAIAAMVRTKRAFTRLAELDVSFNELSREGLQAAQELAPSVVSRRQHRPGDGLEKRIRRWAGTRLTVAEGIADPKAWRKAGIDGDMRWARYRGEDDYELFVARDLDRYRCTCPSSYQPCKHVVALALLAERGHVPEAPCPFATH